ncbi:serine/threonine-protein kinase pim-1-like [Trichomycterus rosablanca]|uniref:serine/threonine-protein kinase pim-1-like n=1 Tax=Trichomycterus rosablanca TaxID=2290929 RepID=UPI002F35AC0F
MLPITRMLKKNPLKETPVKEKLIKEKPLKENPLKETQLKKKLLKENPLKETPLKKKLLKDNPLKENPLKKKLLKENPRKETPLKKKLLKDNPLKENPLKENTVKEKPLKDKPPMEDVKRRRRLTRTRTALRADTPLESCWEREAVVRSTKASVRWTGTRILPTTYRDIIETNPGCTLRRSESLVIPDTTGCFRMSRGVHVSAVAIKYVVKDEHLRFTRIPGETELLPVEVALMRMVSRPPISPYVLKLLEWFDTPERCVLILERPVPCVDLYQLMLEKGRLRMPFARHVMRRVVLAVLHCRDRGVLHRDIKLQNILLNTETLEVKLIDFGCGDLLKDTPYYTYSGTWVYSPPEWITKKKYYGCPATVWSLGVLLFFLVCGRLPFRSKKEITKGQLVYKPGVSHACCHLTEQCLKKKPSKRLTLGQILLHGWFHE